MHKIIRFWINNPHYGAHNIGAGIGVIIVLLFAAFGSAKRESTVSTQASMFGKPREIPTTMSSCSRRIFLDPLHSLATCDYTVTWQP